MATDRERERNVELCREQSELCQLFASSCQRLVNIIKDAGSLGESRQLRLANAIMSQTNKRMRAYIAALLGVSDTFEEILNNARKSAGHREA